MKSHRLSPLLTARIMFLPGGLFRLTIYKVGSRDFVRVWNLKELGFSQLESMEIRRKDPIITLRFLDTVVAKVDRERMENVNARRAPLSERHGVLDM